MILIIMYYYRYYYIIIILQPVDGAVAVSGMSRTYGESSK